MKEKNNYFHLLIGLVCISLIFFPLLSSPPIKNQKNNRETADTLIKEHTPHNETSHRRNQLPTHVGEQYTTKRENQNLFTKKSENIKNMTNNGWSWRPSTPLKKEDATYYQEFYNNTSDEWDFRQETQDMQATGQHIETVKQPSSDVQHVFVANHTKKYSNGSAYYEIQHWKVDYTGLEGSKKREIRPKTDLRFSLAARNVTKNRNVTNNKVLRFLDLSAEVVWGDYILLYYTLLERKPNGNLTAVLYHRLWSGSWLVWFDAMDIVTTPNGFSNVILNVTNVGNLHTYYMNKTNTTITYFRSRYKGINTTSKESYYLEGMFIIKLGKDYSSHWMFFKSVHSTEETPAPELPEYTVGDPLYYNSTSLLLYFPLLTISEEIGQVCIIKANLTTGYVAPNPIATLFNFPVTSLDVRLGAISGAYYKKNSSCSHVSVSWTIHADESTSELWMGNALVNESKEERLESEKLLLSQYGPSTPKMRAYTRNSTYLFYSDFSHGFKEVEFMKFNAQNSTQRIQERTTESNTTTVTYDVQLVRYGSLQGSFLISHIAYKEQNGGTTPIAMLTLGMNDSDADGLGNIEENEYYEDRELNSTDPDTDGDGINDGAELFRYHTSPTNQDSDEDGLDDDEELVTYGTDPTDPDSDGDGLDDSEEIHYGSNPLLIDSDDDGLDDSTEITLKNQYGCNVTASDADDDGLTDVQEVSYGTMCNMSDSDKDGLNDYVEIETYTTDPTDPDTDGEGLNDSAEIRYNTNPHKNDTDDDGLNDSVELLVYETDPVNPYTDDDELNDSEEVWHEYAIDPTLTDTDGDGLSDSVEVKGRTHPCKRDTDGDGLSDYAELERYGTDPTTPDTDGDFIPDKFEYRIPFLAVIPIWWLIAGVLLILGFVKAWNYGLFKQMEVSTAGMNSEGGTLMFALNKKNIAEKVDPSLFASSLTGTFDLLQENLGVEQDYAVMGKQPRLIVSKEAETYLWVQVDETYPMLINKVKKVHKEAVEEYSELFDGNIVQPDRLTPVRDFVKGRLPLSQVQPRQKVETEQEVKEDEASSGVPDIPDFEEELEE